MWKHKREQTSNEVMVLPAMAIYYQLLATEQNF